MFFGQKLKTTFFKESDRSSWFFHSLMNQKHRRNHIAAIQWANGIFTALVNEVGEVLVQYYQALLNSSKATILIDVEAALNDPYLNDNSHAFY